MLAILLLSAPVYADNLVEAVARALAVSPRMDEARAKIDEATFAIDEALAPGRPQLGMNASYTHLDPTVTVPFANLEITAEHNYLVGLRLQQTLADFGRVHYANQAAEQHRRASRFELEESRLGLAQETALVFLQRLLAEQAVSVARDELASRGEQLEVARHRLETGAVARFDVIRSQAEVAAARQRLLAAENGQRLAQARLESLTGGPLTPSELGDLPTPPAQLEPGLELALQRPSLAALRAEVASAQARVGLAQSGDNPRLALQTEYLQRNATGFSPDHQWTVTVQLEVPLFDGGLTGARAAQAGSRLEQLEARLREAERTTRLEAEDAFLNLGSRWLELEASREKLEQAGEARRISVLRYGHGLGTLVELLDAEASLTAARVDASRARYDYAAAWVAWGRVTGRLAETLQSLCEEDEDA
ncbi:MAG: TolC family protein [Candidatus Eremiobacteraeota bacterium]|nr:TolC family protein [Candidatus Eremiobacteraeota bacterium]